MARQCGLSSRKGCIGDLEKDERLAVADLAALEYQVTLLAHKGVGLNMRLEGDMFVVQEVVPEGPAAASQRIRAGDMLLAVNGEDLHQLSFKDKIALLVWLGSATDGCPVLLRFKSHEALGRVERDHHDGAVANPFFPLLEEVGCRAGAGAGEGALEAYHHHLDGESLEDLLEQQTRLLADMLDVGLALPSALGRLAASGGGSPAGVPAWDNAGEMVKRLMSSKLLTWGQGAVIPQGGGTPRESVVKIGRGTRLNSSHCDLSRMPSSA